MSDSSKYPLILRFKHIPDERGVEIPVDFVTVTYNEIWAQRGRKYDQIGWYAKTSENGLVYTLWRYDGAFYTDFEIVENVKHKVRPRFEIQIIKAYADTNNTDVLTAAYNEGWDLKGTYVHAAMVCFYMVREKEG